MKRLAAFILMLVLAPAGLACDKFTHPPFAEKAITPLWVGPAFSGSWFTSSRPGEGFILQVLDNGTALLLWFTYPPAGSSAQQAWIYADGGVIDGDRIRFTNAVTTRGGRFGVTGGARPAVQRIPWGTVEFHFSSCNAGEVTYAGPAEWGSGTRVITRLTEHAELGCAGKRRITATGTRVLDGLKQRSGGWYNAASDADGWAYEELADGRAIVYWFTHDAAGEQAWTYGEAAAAGDRAVVTNYRPVGARFGAAFNPAQVLMSSWGTLDFAFGGCSQATLSYASFDSAFGSGALVPQRLSTLAGASCLASTPTVPANGTWSAGTLMPAQESEVATAIVGSRICAAGGYPARRPFQCYDAAANAWTTLAPLPAGRDHGMAVGHEGAIYFTGGNGEDGNSYGWRYDFAANQWQAIAALPLSSASGAALLDGFLYFGSVGGALYQFNPRTQAVRMIAADGRVLRDHSQVVAFQGEIWLMGGRNAFGQPNPAVSIWDPASETWRAGPSMLNNRSGFAAAATPTAILVAGGEKLDAPSGVIASAEGIAAGDTSWTSLPNLPIPVHGVGSAIYGNAFFLIGGSRVQATAVNFGDVQIYRW